MPFWNSYRSLCPPYWIQCTTSFPGSCDPALGHVIMIMIYSKPVDIIWLERLRFTFTPNGKREFVPRDQVLRPKTLWTKTKTPLTKTKTPWTKTKTLWTKTTDASRWGQCPLRNLLRRFGNVVEFPLQYLVVIVKSITYLSFRLLCGKYFACFKPHWKCLRW